MKDVFSAQSGRKLASIELIDAADPISTGDRYNFRVLNGFGNMWRKCFEESDMTLFVEDDELLLRIVAFPAEEGMLGILDIDMLLPPRTQQDVVASVAPSFFDTVRSYFFARQKG